MGVYAARQALRDAGIEWSDLQFAFGGSLGFASSAAARTPDTMVGRLGLTGLQFVNVVNGCATAGTRAADGVQRHRVRASATSASSSASTSTRAARSTPTRRSLGLGQWYGDVGHDAHHAVLRHEDQPLHARLRHHASRRWPRWRRRPSATASLNPNAWRRKPLSEEEILEVADAQLPAHAVHVLLARRGRGRGRRVPGRPGAPLHRPARVRARRRRAHAAVRVVRGDGAVAADRAGRVADRRRVAARATRWRASGPTTSQVAQMQDTEAGAEIMHMAENGFCERRRAGAHDPRRRDRDRRPPADQHRRRAASPTASPSARRACARSTRSASSCAATPATARCPATPRVGYTQVYGAPGIGACSILTR